MLDVRKDGTLVVSMSQPSGQAGPQGPHQWASAGRRQRGRQSHGDVRRHRAWLHPGRQSRRRTSKTYSFSSSEGLRDAEQVQDARQRLRARFIEYEHGDYYIRDFIYYYYYYGERFHGEAIKDPGLWQEGLHRRTRREPVQGDHLL